jgi:hypothetical protein
MHRRKEECIRSCGSKTWKKEATKRTSHRWEDNMKTDCKEIGWGRFIWLRIGINGRILQMQ